MREVITAQVNGRLTRIATGTTITRLLESRDLMPRHVVVEHNGEPLMRADYDVVIAAGDRIEIVRAVAGGSGGRDRAWRRQRLAAGRLYCCTDRRADRGDLSLFLDAILDAGVDVVQLRDKHASSDQLAEAAVVFASAAARHDALFIINDSPQIAADVGADGVHVGQEDPAPSRAREVVGPQRLVGRSTHSVTQIDAALTEDCDYFAVGPVHATPTKAGRPPVGLAPVRYAANVADRPWYVTGAMAVDTSPAVLAAGAHRLVVVRAVTDADDPGQAVRDLRQVIDAHT